LPRPGRRRKDHRPWPALLHRLAQLLRHRASGLWLRRGRPSINLARNPEPHHRQPRQVPIPSSTTPSRNRRSRSGSPPSIRPTLLTVTSAGKPEPVNWMRHQRRVIGQRAAAVRLVRDERTDPPIHHRPAACCATIAARTDCPDAGHKLVRFNRRPKKAGSNRFCPCGVGTRPVPSAFDIRDRRPCVPHVGAEPDRPPDMAFPSNGGHQRAGRDPLLLAPTTATPVDSSTSGARSDPSLGPRSAQSPTPVALSRPGRATLLSVTCGLPPFDFIRTRDNLPGLRLSATDYVRNATPMRFLEVGCLRVATGWGGGGVGGGGGHNLGRHRPEITLAPQTMSPTVEVTLGYATTITAPGSHRRYSLPTPSELSTSPASCSMSRSPPWARPSKITSYLSTAKKTIPPASWHPKASQHPTPRWIVCRRFWPRDGAARCRRPPPPNA